ncbi:holo-ACP synthase [Limosilactobacillus oris]|uniref:holo-ACP synthase n=1 Tax=Limosilactobacillus oris TaxID=1632 RepID=UPI00223576EA|nr:holo-ACP synthase [Limosilactobacillus oris]MCW4388619.1 holo-ACP synthase [Limosilactobacillus oris]
MIKGLGIDLTEISRVGELASKHPQFLDRVLTTAEQKQYHGFTGQRALEYLAGRWSLKESFAKAWGTGIGKAVGFQDVEILDSRLGNPVVTRSPFAGRVHASVSHTGSLVMTEIILETD